MRVEFRESFLRDLKRIKDQRVRGRIRAMIELVERAQTLDKAGDVKKLRSDARGAAYRIRLGDYRLGLLQQGDTIVFVRALHRKDMYRYFP